jgi:ubiquinone biosynthesis protein
LQKTLLNIEGLGRDLDPDLDLWTTAKPYLETWMADQLGFRGFARRLHKEASSWGIMFPQFPRLMHQALTETRVKGLEQRMDAFIAEKRRQNVVLTILVVLLTLSALWQIW